MQDALNENYSISLQTDLIIAEILLSNDLIVKTAQDSSSFFGSIIDGVKSFISSAVPGEKTSDSVLNFIAPGVIYTTLSSMGFGGKLTKIITLATAVFHIDVTSIFSEIYDKIKELISGDKKTTSQAVGAIATTAVQNNMKPISEEEDESIRKKFQEELKKIESFKNNKIIKNSYINFDHLPYKITTRREIRAAKIIRASLDRNDYLFIKTSGWGSKNQTITGNILSRILGFVFSSILASTGFLIAGDVFNTAVGRSSALTGTLSGGKPIAGTQKSDSPSATTVSSPSKKSVKNIKYLSPSYTEENYNTSAIWSLNIPVDKSSISNMLISFANQVYSNLKDKTNEINASPSFNFLVEKIFNENSEREGAQILIIPREFHSRRDLVDYFIDDINFNTTTQTKQDIKA